MTRCEYRPLRFWQAISRIPSLKGPRFLWQVELADQWDTCQQLLTSTSDLAEWTLARDGVTVCEVVAHHDTSLVGIDRTSGECFPVTREQQTIYRFNLRLLGSRIIALLGGRLEYEQSIDYGSLHRLGRLDSRFAAATLHLCTKDDSDSILALATHLSVGHRKHIVLIPRQSNNVIDFDTILDRYGVLVLPADSLIVEANNVWVCDPDAVEQIRHRLGIQDQTTPNSFRLVGENYEIRFEGKSLSLSDSVGLWYLREFISHPKKTFEPVELEAARTGVRARSSNSSTGESFDLDARRQYSSHLVEIEDQISEAQSFNDLGRIEHLQAERQQILDHVAKSVGIGGKARIVTDAGKARKNIRQQVKRDIDRIAKAHSELAKHLQLAFQSDPMCYAPNQETFWQF